jgi:hypothetical protein
VQGDYVNVPTFSAGLALSAAVAGDLQLARQLLDHQADTGFTSIRRDAEWLPVIGLLSHAAALVGDRHHAEMLYDLLASSPARTVRVGPLAGWWGPVDYHLGALCRVLERPEEAEHRLQASLVLTEELGARPFYARTQIELARVLEGKGGAARRRQASQLRDAASALAAQLGAAGIA